MASFILAGRTTGRLALGIGPFDRKRADPAIAKSEFIRTAIGIVGHADCAANDGYAIRWASQSGHAGVVKPLLDDPRVERAAQDSYGIKWASINGHTNIVKLLLEDPRVDPHRIDMENAFAAVKQELEYIHAIPRVVLEACLFGICMILDQLEKMK